MVIVSVLQPPLGVAVAGTNDNYLRSSAGRPSGRSQETIPVAERSVDGCGPPGARWRHQRQLQQTANGCRTDALADFQTLQTEDLLSSAAKRTSATGSHVTGTCGWAADMAATLVWNVFIISKMASSPCIG